MVRMAMIGDQGLGRRSEAVLNLIRDAAADFLVVVGDFDYTDKPEVWASQLDRLGRDFPLVCRDWKSRCREMATIRTPDCGPPSAHRRGTVHW